MAKRSGTARRRIPFTGTASSRRPSTTGSGTAPWKSANYTYQWQPNFIGFYFCHCHRNTVQHFEFGLYQALLIEPPDAYFATLWDPTIPIGNGRPSVGYPKEPGASPLTSTLFTDRRPGGRVRRRRVLGPRL